MTWGRVDDTFDGHRKRRLGSLAADGLLMRAIAHAAKHETDGFIDRAWVNQQSKAAERRRALREALKINLLEDFPAGTTREIDAPYRKGIRDKARTVTVGPFGEDGYLVHDFLDFQPARIDLEEKRSKERQKKRSSKDTPKLWNGSFAGSSDAAVPPGNPPLEGDSGMGTSSAPSGSDDGDRRELLAVAPIVEVFAEFGVVVDEISVANAIRRFPGIDHLGEARGCAEWVRAHPEKPAGHTLHRYFANAKAAKPDDDDESARRAAALRAAVEGRG